MSAIDPIATNGYIEIEQGGTACETLRVRIQQIQIEQVRIPLPYTHQQPFAIGLRLLLEVC